MYDVYFIIDIIYKRRNQQKSAPVLTGGRKKSAKCRREGRCIRSDFLFPKTVSRPVRIDLVDTIMYSVGQRADAERTKNEEEF